MPTITARRFFIGIGLVIFLFLAFGPSGYYDKNDNYDETRYKSIAKRHKHIDGHEAHQHPIKNTKQKRNKEQFKQNKEKIIEIFKQDIPVRPQVGKENKRTHPKKLKPPAVSDLMLDSSSGDQKTKTKNVIVTDKSEDEPESGDMTSVGNKQTVDEEGNPLPFPVYESVDEHIPEETSKIASEKLNCRASVVEFVINATDVKDECEGLRKAFDSSCTVGDPSQAGSSSVFSSKRMRRRLEDGGIGSPDDGTSLLSSIMLGNNKATIYRALFSIQEEMSSRIEYAVDTLFHGRRMQPVAPAEELVDDEGAQLKPGEDSNPVKPEPGAGEQHSTGISIPTSSQRIGDHVFTDTLLFQEGPIGLSSQKAPDDAVVEDAKPQKAPVAKKRMKADNVEPKQEESAGPLQFTPEAEELKLCCSSIMNVYHEHCDRQEDEELNDRRLILIVSVIALCSLVKSLIRHFEIRWLPEAAGCILVGVFGGMFIETMPHLDVGFDEKLFLRVMLPPIVFEAALNIDKRSFQRHAFPIFLYAVIGTIVSALIAAFIVFKGSGYLTSCVSIPFTESLLFGALISSIDPIAVLSILSNMGMRDTDTIYVLIFGESLLNDGVAIVLFDTLVHFLDDNLVLDGVAIWDAIQHFLVVALGSVFFGSLSGACCTTYFWAMHGCQSPLVEVMAFVCWALIPYYICDNIRWSGIVAIVAAGMVMDIYVVGYDYRKNRIQPRLNLHDDESCQEFHCGPYSERETNRRRSRPIFSKEGHMSPTARTHIGFVTEIISTLMETAIFAYLGLFLFNVRYHWSFNLSALAIISCVVSRSVMIPTLSFLANTMEKFRRRSRKDDREKTTNTTSSSESELSSIIIDKRMQLVLLFAGLRGAVSFALVENVPLYDSASGHGSRFKPELKSMTSACIVFTVFILGGSTYYLLEKLGISLKKEPHSVEMVNLLGEQMQRKNSDFEKYSDSSSLTDASSEHGKMKRGSLTGV